MGYLYLSVALFANTLKGYCGKKTSGYTHSIGDAVLANGIRMILCAVIGFVLILATEGASALAPSPQLLALAALSGVSTAVFVVSWLICVRKNAFMLLDVFLMLGVLIPLAAGSIFFRETVKLTQWLGIALLFAAVLIMCSYNNSVKSRLDLPAVLLLLLCGTACGTADLSQMLVTRLMAGASAAVFNFYTYLFAALTLAVAYAFTRRTVTAAGKADLGRIFGYIALMALCLFSNSYFKTLAAGKLSAVLLYPLNQGCALAFSSIMSAALFGEKLTAKAIIGILTAFVALLIINVL